MNKTKRLQKSQSEAQKRIEHCLSLYSLSTDKGGISAKSIQKIPQTLPKPTIQRTPKGKPYFSSPELAHIHFSISHSGRIWAALFAETEVGLDIEDRAFRFLEKPYDPVQYRKIAERFFSQEELSHLLQAENAHAHEETFFSIWTKKEAYLKYTGDGITRSLSDFSVYNSDVPFQNIFIEEGIRCTACAAEIEKEPIQIVRL